ncbi:hypothetical protein KR767_15550 [Luteibacter anthropi]|uniref:hypothetical protein n=1 Tax=Luteibacter anthropi TaxID=564369 RepID=UPI0020325147|nr:hypothetical protein [Luteibacter anthropi]URX61472.1 hypothetical protein KR767_15550 [Luteibacter anthropi]
MDKNILALTVLVITVTGFTSTASSEDVDKSNIDRIVKSVMNDAYGQNFNAPNNCWSYKWKDEQGNLLDYCMRPATPRVVEEPRGRFLYLHTSNATDIRGDARYGYSQVQPGLMGAFKIRIGGPQGWTYDALDAAMDYGTAGECGCAQARLVKLSGSGNYGWIFASGGTWQGLTVANYSIVTAIKGRIKDISRIPQVTEKDQAVKYVLSVNDVAGEKGFYSLHIVKSGQEGQPEVFDVAFDPVKMVYALPSGR